MLCDLGVGGGGQDDVPAASLIGVNESAVGFGGLHVVGAGNGGLEPGRGGAANEENGEERGGSEGGDRLEGGFGVAVAGGGGKGERAVKPALAFAEGVESAADGDGEE